MAWRREKERYAMTVLALTVEYDEYMNMFAQGPLRANFPPLGENGALWTDWADMGDYQSADSFLVFCFSAVSKTTEKLMKGKDMVDGWRLLGFEALGLWSPIIQIELTKEGRTDDEKLHMFQRDQDQPFALAGRYYTGGSFRKSLPSSAKLKERECSNPACRKKEEVIKMYATGEKRTETKTNLSRCSRCLEALYCSRDCQLAHFPAHKKECKRLAST